MATVLIIARNMVRVITIPDGIAKAIGEVIGIGPIEGIIAVVCIKS
tara:strand:+ start:2769 stop:2906 length:138 start_codon:yes stop_codon:yes gene_type:complete